MSDTEDNQRCPWSHDEGQVQGQGFSRCDDPWIVGFSPILKIQYLPLPINAQRCGYEGKQIVIQYTMTCFSNPSMVSSKHPEVKLTSVSIPLEIYIARNSSTHQQSSIRCRFKVASRLDGARLRWPKAKGPWFVIKLQLTIILCRLQNTRSKVVTVNWG